MIRSTLPFAAVAAVFALPVAAQDRAAEARTAAEQAAEAVAEALEAAQAAEPQLPGEPLTLPDSVAEPAVQPPEEPLPREDLQAAAPPADQQLAGQTPTEWIAEPVVQAIDDPARGPDQTAERGVNEAGQPAYPPYPVARETPLEPVRARRTARRVVEAGYSPEQRGVWLAQCRDLYFGTFDCAGYLAQYEQTLAATLAGDLPEAYPAASATWISVPIRRRRCACDHVPEERIEEGDAQPAAIIRPVRAEAGPAKRLRYRN